MKKWNNSFISICLLLFLAFTMNTSAYAQESVSHKKQAQIASIESMVEARDYVFVVQSVTSASGPTRQLTPYYTLKVHKDTVVSDLPYFGRAYVAPIDPSAAGFHFTSTKFSYDLSKRKKGGWEADIKPTDQSDVRELFLTIYENGNASLIVNSNNRQSISYNGYIKAPGEK